MNLIMHNRPKDVIPQQLPNGVYYDGRYGFWGNVTAVNSRNNCCDIISDTGYKFRNIPVATREWVNSSGSGERNLPPVDSRVFILMPTGTISGAFILCSGYAIGETDTHNLYAQNDSDKDYYNKTIEKHSQSGWIEKENQETGNRSIESSDGNIKVEINLADNSEKSETKGVTITAWDHTITITEDKIEMTANKAVTITAEDSVSLTAKNGLTIDGNNKSVEIKNASTFKVNGNLEVSV